MDIDEEVKLKQKTAFDNENYLMDALNKINCVVTGPGTGLTEEDKEKLREQILDLADISTKVRVGNRDALEKLGRLR